MQVTQAWDGSFIADVTADSEEMLKVKLDRAAACFQDRAGWLPAFKRIDILRKLAALVQDEAETFAILIAREGGKPLTDARVEVTRAINGIEGAASDLTHLTGTEIPMGLTPASANRWAFTTREPLGVVIAISAFNHPLNLIVHQVVPAIAVGCPVLIKPASTTPLTCLRFLELIRETGLPDAWCQSIVPEKVSHLDPLLADNRVAFLSFIGSGGVGWALRSKLAPGTRCALEHGGSAPVIVDSSADIDGLIEPLVKGGYYHAGQVCVSVQRIFVQEKVRDIFIERFTDRVRALRVGDPRSQETEVGPLILPKEVERVEAWVAQALAHGADLATGGKRLTDRSYQPTVLLEPPITTHVSTEEVFGPVTCIYGYQSLDDAIARANGLPLAFQAAVFSQDINVALKAARCLDASAVLINDHTAFRTDWMPFAGRRQSGYGIGGIPHTMHEMTQSKMIVMKHLQ